MNNLECITVLPDYKRIYNDMIDLKYPEKKEICSNLLSKNTLSTLDIIKINKILCNKNSRENSKFNQRHRSYDKLSILKILEYQKEYDLNNSQLARYYKLSRNTVTKWKKQFLV